MRRAGSRSPLVLVAFAAVLATGLALGACSGAREAGRELGDNDVSILFPAAGAEALWPATLAGRGGPLLPAEVFARIGLSLVREVDDEAEHAALRVVAARFDPCFAPAIGGPCQPQIRLVMQIPDPAGGFFDGAVHTLYALSPQDFDAAVAELRALAALAPENAGQPLGPSPALVAQGLQGAYARGLQALVTRYAGAGSLVRMTFMTRTFSRSGQWQLGGFHVGGTNDKITIVGIGATQQNVTRSIAHTFEYDVVPAFMDPTGRPGASASRLDRLDPAARADVHAWAIRQQDPRQTLPDTTDCASCHIAGHTARHLEAAAPELVTPAIGAMRGARVVGAAEHDADNLRAFGWFGKAPHVAQRTANETRAVLAAIGGR